MLREERWQKLEAFIREREFVSYADMLREFGISKSTAYRDLQTVCKQHPGIVFTRGGVMNIKGNVGSEATLSQRSTQFTAEKQRIAKPFVVCENLHIVFQAYIIERVSNPRPIRERIINSHQNRQNEEHTI